jgi:hypothetical protein
LREYIENIQRRAEGLNSTACLRHLLYPSEAQEPISYQAIRLRHLLALNQQNEPVVLEIMAILQRLTSRGNEDFSILTMLALQPGLLLEPPLRQFGRELLVKLAIRTINDPVASGALKSDALIVLATYRGALRHHFQDLALVVLANGDLRRQSAALALVQQSDGGGPALGIIESSFPRLNATLQRSAEQLCHLVAVCTAIQQTNRSARREEEFRTIIKRLGSRMLPHTTEMEDDWDDVGTDLSNLATYWGQLASLQRRRASLNLARRAIAVAERTLLPAFPALSYFARTQGLGDVAKSLDDDHVKAHSRLADFRRRLPREPRLLVKTSAAALNQSFFQLRKATWFAPTSDRVLRGDATDADSGPLVQALPRLFASPTNLLVKVAEEIFQVRTAISKLQEVGGRASSPQLTISQVPCEELRHIYKLLLTNIQTYGDPASLRATSDLELRADGTMIWSVEIINTVREACASGHGAGVDTAIRHATQFGITITSEPRGKNRWTTRIRIPQSFHLDELTDSFST